MSESTPPAAWLRERWAVVVGALLFVLAYSAVSRSPDGGSLFGASARATAVVLLSAVTWSVVQMAQQWRVFIRHDSIRSDIAAAGGLGKRLSV